MLVNPYCSFVSLMPIFTNALIQFKKKILHLHQLFKRQIPISSELLCMSSLPVSIKRIPSRTSEKKWQHRFSHYNTICCHGNQWSNLAKFRIIQPFMHVLIACKYEKDLMKNSGENVITSFSPLYARGIFFRHSRAANSVVYGQISPNPFKLLCISSLPASMKCIRSKTFKKMR